MGTVAKHEQGSAPAQLTEGGDNLGKRKRGSRRTHRREIRVGQDTNGRRPLRPAGRRLLTAAAMTIVTAGAVASAVAVTEVPALTRLEGRLSRFSTVVSSARFGADLWLLAIPLAVMCGVIWLAAWLRWEWRWQRIEVSEWEGVQESNHLRGVQLREVTVTAEDLETQRVQLGQQLDAMTVTLKQQRSSLDSSKNHVVQLTAEFNAFRQRTAVIEFDLDAATNKLTEAGERVTTLERDLSERTEQSNRFETEAMEMTRRAVEAESQIAARSDKISTLEMHLSDARSEVSSLSTSLSESAAKIKVMQTQLLVSSTDRKDLIGRLTRAERQLQDLKESVGTARASADQLARLEQNVVEALHEAEAARAQLITSEETTKVLTRRLAEAEEARCLQDDQIADLSAQTATERTRATDLHLASEESTRLLELARTEQRSAEATAAVLEEELASVRVSLEERETLRHEARAAAENADHLRGLTREAEAHGDRLKGELMGATARSEALRKQLSQALAQNAELAVVRGELNAIEARSTELRFQLRSALSEAVELREQLAVSQATQRPAADPDVELPSNVIDLRREPAAAVS